MKLLTRTTILYVIITVVVFTAGSFLFYKFLRDLEDEEITEGLESKKEMLIEIIHRDSMIQNSPLAEDVNIQPTPGIFEGFFTDTSMYDPYNKEALPYRMLTFPIETDGNFYAVTIRKVMLESDDLIESIFMAFISLLVILGVVVIATMQLVARRMWKPFFITLERVREFLPGGKQEIELPPTRVSEFRDLNASIKKMIANTESAFQSLKSFSENAAHEIQTPLAVIQSTIEVLRQDPLLTEEQHVKIYQLGSTTARLSNIVSTLLLLTRIGNKQYLQETPIDFSEAVISKVASLKELFDQRGIKLEAEISPGIKLKLHKVLADILISNLLVNALRHTPMNGNASVLLTANSLVVSNSGNPLKGDPTKLFERFYKEDQSEQSTGLGLSLVKMVTDTSGFRVSYEYSSRNHVFSVHF